MKKLFTLIGIAAIIALGGNAAKLDPSKVMFGGFKPGLAEKMEQTKSLSDLYNTEDGRKKVIKKSWEQGNNVYELYFMKVSQLTRALSLYTKNDQGEEVVMDHEDCPFYFVRMQLDRKPRNGQVNTTIDCCLSWPTYRSWKSIDDLEDESLSLKMVSLQDFIESTDASHIFRWSNFTGTQIGSNFMPTVNSSNDITTFPIWSNMMSEITQKYNGASGLTFTTEGVRITQFTLESVDFEDEYSTKMPFDFYFDNSTSCSGIYNGPATYVDFFEEYRGFDVNEMHIFAAGLQNSTTNTDYDISYNFPDAAWTVPEVNKFYIVATNDKASVVVQNTGGMSKVPFDSNLILFDFKEEDVLQVNYFRGAMYSNPNITIPTATQWRLIEPKEVYDEEMKMYFLGINPTYESLIPGGYDSNFYYWTNNDGAQACSNGYVYYPNYFLQIANGTPDGIYMYGGDTAENYYGFGADKEGTHAYNGKIFYHNDPTNMLTYEELDSVGDYTFDKITDGVEEIFAEENAVVTVENGVINITPENNAQVAVYSLDGAMVANANVVAGETLSVAVDGGLYIVKVGKTACKVML